MSGSRAVLLSDNYMLPALHESFLIEVVSLPSFCH